MKNSLYKIFFIIKELLKGFFVVLITALIAGGIPYLILLFGGMLDIIRVERFTIFAFFWPIIAVIIGLYKAARYFSKKNSIRGIGAVSMAFIATFIALALTPFGIAGMKTMSLKPGVTTMSEARNIMDWPWGGGKCQPVQIEGFKEKLKQYNDQCAIGTTAYDRSRLSAFTEGVTSEMRKRHPERPNFGLHDVDLINKCNKMSRDLEDHFRSYANATDEIYNCIVVRNTQSITMCDYTFSETRERYFYDEEEILCPSLKH